MKIIKCDEIWIILTLFFGTIFEYHPISFTTVLTIVNMCLYLNCQNISTLKSIELPRASKFEHWMECRMVSKNSKFIKIYKRVYFTEFEIPN